MKRATIIHCWEGKPDYCWYPKTKSELGEKGFEVTVPEMPNPYTPQLNEWLKKINALYPKLDEDLFLIGHSLGCISILKYLEQFSGSEKVGGVILVAGFSKSLGRGYEKLDNFFEVPVDYAKIKNNSKNFILINSDDDSHVSLNFAEIFKEKLDAKLIIKHHMGHFSGGIGVPESVTSLPDVADEILKMIS